MRRLLTMITLCAGMSTTAFAACRDNVVLVHGNTASPSSWNNTINELKRKGYVDSEIFTPDWGSKSCASCNDHNGSEETPVRNAILTAINQSCTGKIDIIGHSMGGSAVAIALSEGVESKKVVLISSPSSIESVLKRFAKFIGLPTKSTQRFLNLVGENVGRSAESLNIAKLIQSNSSKGLIIHDKDDMEIPYADARTLEQNWKGAKLISTQGYGHRSILRQKDVWASILGFVQEA